MTTAISDQPLGYPINLAVERPEKQSRITNFPLAIGFIIRVILTIPHLIVLSLFEIVVTIVYLIATFAILFTGVYPRGMYDLVAGYQRWTARVTGYLYSLYDPYPPFSTEERAYPLSLAFVYPESSSRLLNFPILAHTIRTLLLIPHIIVLVFLTLVNFVVLVIAHFAILFTGAFPEGMHSFVTGYLRWSMRVNAYRYGLTDRYPPFSLT